MPWITTIPAGPFQTNCYLIGADGSDKAVLIDAPPESKAEVEAALTAAGRSLEALIITHPHFDHTLDAAAFAADGVPVYAHPDALDDIKHPETHGIIPAPPGGFPGCDELSELPVGGSLTFAGLDLGILNVPGHSEGSVALYFEDACFVGDLIFMSSVGRTDLPGGDYQVLSESIRKNIYVLPDETALYPGHGPATSVGREKDHNPYVRP